MKLFRHKKEAKSLAEVTDGIANDIKKYIIGTLEETEAEKANCMVSFLDGDDYKAILFKVKATGTQCEVFIKIDIEIDVSLDPEKVCSEVRNKVKEKFISSFKEIDNQSFYVSKK